MKLNRILETCLYVRDLDAAFQFYQDVLGLELFSKMDNRHVFFRCGNAMLLLFNPDITMEAGKDVPPHGAYGEGHVAFYVEKAEMEKWRRHLLEHSVEIEAEIAWPNGGESIYFRDPAGNSLELASSGTWGIGNDE